MLFNLVKSLCGGSQREPQKPECLQQIETWEIQTLLPALKTESVQANKALAEILQLNIDKSDLQNPIMYNPSIENSQKLDSLEILRQSLAKEHSSARHGLALKDLVQYETLKQEFFVLVDEAHSYVQNIADSRTSCTAFYDYIQTTLQLKSLKTYVSTIREATITASPEEWISCLTATKKVTRQTLQDESVRTVQELISIHKKDPLYKQLASRVEEINTLNESLYKEIIKLADSPQARLLSQVQVPPNKEVPSHKLDSLTGFEPTFSEPSFTFQINRKTMSPKVKSAIKTDSNQNKQIAWSTPEAGASATGNFKQVLDSPDAARGASTSVKKKSVKQEEPLLPSRAIRLNALTDKPLCYITPMDTAGLGLIPGSVISALVFFFIYIVQTKSSAGKKSASING